MLENRYWAYKNAESMDGLPGMKRGVETGKRENVEPIKKMVGPYAPSKIKKPEKKLATSPITIAITSFCMGLLVAFFLFEYLRGDLRGDIVNYTEEIRALLR